MKLPNEILAFKLLKEAKLTQEEHLLVLTGLNYTDKATLFEQAKKSLKKFKGDQLSTASKDGAGSTSEEIKFEPSFLIQHEEALLAAGYDSTMVQHQEEDEEEVAIVTTVEEGCK